MARNDDILEKPDSKDLKEFESLINKHYMQEGKLKPVLLNWRKVSTISIKRSSTVLNTTHSMNSAMKNLAFRGRLFMYIYPY